MFGLELVTGDGITNGIAAGGSAGFLFLISRWLWHYEQIVTTRYEHEIKSNSIRIDTLEAALDRETKVRQQAQEAQARMTRILIAKGIDPNDPEILKLWEDRKSP